jgi:hypothetical protein
MEKQRHILGGNKSFSILKILNQSSISNEENKNQSAKENLNSSKQISKKYCIVNSERALKNEDTPNLSYLNSERTQEGSFSDYLIPSEEKKSLTKEVILINDVPDFNIVNENNKIEINQSRNSSTNWNNSNLSIHKQENITIQNEKEDKLLKKSKTSEQFKIFNYDCLKICNKQESLYNKKVIETALNDEKYNNNDDNNNIPLYKKPVLKIPRMNKYNKEKSIYNLKINNSDISYTNTLPSNEKETFITTDNNESIMESKYIKEFNVKTKILKSNKDDIMIEIDKTSQKLNDLSSSNPEFEKVDESIREKLIKNLENFKLSNVKEKLESLIQNSNMSQLKCPEVKLYN